MPIEDDYAHLGLPAAAIAQLDTMLGLEHWDLTDDQRNWLYYFCLFSAYSAKCHSCGGYHKPMEITTQFFTFNQPEIYDEYLCPATGEKLHIVLGGEFGGYAATLYPDNQRR